MSIILYIVTVNLLLGLFAGIVMHRSDYCVAGMFRDLFIFKNSPLLKTLLLLIVASMVAFEVLRLSGWLVYYPFPFLVPPTLANLVGGIVFGIGMVLAGGCVVGTLYKTGAGSIISATALVGLIIGSGIYAEIHPVWVKFLKKTILLPGKITISQALGINPTILLLPVVAVCCIAFYNWHKNQEWELSSQAEGYIQPWKTALILALLGAISYPLFGMPLGITTAYAKTAGYIVNFFAPEHVARAPFYQGVPLHYYLPFTKAPFEGGSGPVADILSYVQYPLIAGIILGAFFSAIRLGEFKVHYRVPGRQYLSALIGGIILALGSRMTPGCNIWHLFGGIPILAMSSLLFLAGIIPGAYIGSKILVTFVLSVPPKG